MSTDLALTGSSVVGHDLRRLQPFAAIESHIVADLSIQHGAAHTADIEFDDNLLDQVVLGVEDGVLRVTLFEPKPRQHTHSIPDDGSPVSMVSVLQSGQRMLASSHMRCAIRITLPELRKLTLHGHGVIHARDIRTPVFEYVINGSGDGTLSGSAERLIVEINGSGRVDATALEAIDADVRIAGVGEVLVNARERLATSVAGSGTVSFLGQPVVEKHGPHADAVAPLIDELTRARRGLAHTERMAAVLEERQRIAREIHDTLAQGFTSVIMHLEAAERCLNGDAASAAPHIAEAKRVARDSLRESRRSLWALRPEVLEGDSLSAALRQLVERLNERGAAARFVENGKPRELGTAVDVALLRVAQEACANIQKHARANVVTLTLTFMDDEVALDIQDDGVGFDPAAVRMGASGGSYGLIGMRERVEQFGGSLQIESSPGDGTTIAAHIKA